MVGLTTIRRPVPPALNPDGTTYFLMVASVDGGNSPQLQALDHRTEQLWQVTLPFFSEDRIEDPRVVFVQNHLLAFWIENDILYGMSVDLDGQPLDEVQLYSGSRQVDSYDIALSPKGQLKLWFSGPRSQPGLYLFDESSGIIRVDGEGFNPQIEIDDEGRLHAIWLRNTLGESEHQIFYAFYPDGQFSASRENHIHSINVSTSSGLNGPILGLDQSTVYLFWSIVTRTGPSAGAVQGSYTSLPYGGDAASIAPDQRFRFPNGYDLNYRAVSSGINAGDRASIVDQIYPPVSRLADFSASAGSADEMVVAFRVRLPYLRNKEATQTGLAFLEQGELKSVQLLSFTASESTLPSVQTDQDGYAYVTWLEGAQPGPFRVYLASTAPSLVSELNRLSLEDYLQLAAEISFGLLSGLVLIPFPLAWGLIPALFILFTGGFRKEAEPITARGTLITLSLAFILYWISKVTTLSGITTYVPFSAWLPSLPEPWELPLRIGVPLVTTLLALYVAWRTTYRRERNVPLFFILMFIVVDGLISISIYGVIFYNAV
ncbi:MAG: hypothetical protein ACRDFQ_07565 [Anaerolineales bacterium]